MNNIIISNTCLGQYLMHKFSILPYNNPFIATLIPNDNDYIKLINNLQYYLNLNPILGEAKIDSFFAYQNKQAYYNYPEIKTPYPVIYLGDIEIHCIHENNDSICLDKFKRRQQRMLEIIKTSNYNIIILLSFSEFINHHDNYELIINNFYENNKSNESNLKTYKIFIGPTKYNNKYENYINIDEWNDISLERNVSNVLKFNNQSFITLKMYEYITNNNMINRL